MANSTDAASVHKHIIHRELSLAIDDILMYEIFTEQKPTWLAMKTCWHTFVDKYWVAARLIVRNNQWN